MQGWGSDLHPSGTRTSSLDKISEWSLGLKSSHTSKSLRMAVKCRFVGQLGPNGSVGGSQGSVIFRDVPHDFKVLHVRTQASGSDRSR